LDGRIMEPTDGVELLAGLAVAIVEEPFCCTFRDTAKFRGCILSASLESHLTNTGLLAKYFVRPSALACRVSVLPFSVSVNAPDSAAMDRKSVVVGFVTRFVEPAPEGEAPV